MTKRILSIALLFLIIKFNCFCHSTTEHSAKKNTSAVESDISNSIGKVIFYLENSGSMFGYVNGLTDFVKVVSELAEKPAFVDNNIPREFFFINGGDNIVITPIGNTPSVLKSKLNTTGFNCGDVTKSNLNGMFQIAMQKALDDTISILISDAIYDIGHHLNPHGVLQLEGTGTRSRFIERLREGDLQTIMIKLNSNFNGTYYPVTGGMININQSRPFYIFIFGKTDLLNKYFSEAYISSLSGYNDMARFLIVDNFTIPYQITAHKRIGDFKFDTSNKNKLKKAKSKLNKFQFSFVADLSSLPFSDSYKETIENYTINGNYTIAEITRVEENKPPLFGIPFKPTHLIVVNTDKNPLNSELSISLKNIAPEWIDETHSDSDSNILSDTLHTVGFKYLTNGIKEAYDYKNQNKKLATFIFEITK